LNPIKLNSVSKSFNGKTVFENISYDFKDKSITSVSGPSGCGKTTLLKIISGLILPDSGTVVISENKKISSIFQEPRLMPWYTAIENVINICGSREKEESVKKAEELFDYFELTDAKDKYPSELSGGMAKRISIIRALVHGGNILLCDEPYNGLDLRMCLKAEELFINYAKESCVILVSHDKERTAAASESLDLSM